MSNSATPVQTATPATPAAATTPDATPSKPVDAPPALTRTKVYTTKQVVDGVRVNMGKAHGARVVNGGTPTPPATAVAASPPTLAAPEATPEPTKEPETATAAPTEPVAASAEPDKPAEGVARETPPAAAEEPPKLDNSELAKRLAKISKAEAQVEARERQNAGKLALADALTQAMPGIQLTPDNVREALSRVAAIEQVRQGRGIQSKLALIQQVFGWDFASLADEAVAETGKKPEVRALERVDSTNARLDALTKQLEEDRLRRQQESVEGQVGDYIRTTVATAIADKAKFPLLHGKLGANAAREVYNIQADRWIRFKEGISPEKAAEALEKHFRTQAESDAKLLGLSAPPPATPPKRTEPAGSGRAQKPPAGQPVAPKTVRPRETSRPYSVKSAR